MGVSQTLSISAFNKILIHFINSVMCCLRLGKHVAYWDCYLCILLSFVISILKCSLHYNVILNQHAWSTWCIYHSFHTLLSSSNVHFFRFLLPKLSLFPTYTQICLRKTMISNSLTVESSFIWYVYLHVFLFLFIS